MIFKLLLYLAILSWQGRAWAVSDCPKISGAIATTETNLNSIQSLLNLKLEELGLKNIIFIHKDGALSLTGEINGRKITVAKMTFKKSGDEISYYINVERFARQKGINNFMVDQILKLYPEIKKMSALLHDKNLEIFSEEIANELLARGLISSKDYQRYRNGMIGESFLLSCCKEALKRTSQIELNQIAQSVLSRIPTLKRWEAKGFKMCPGTIQFEFESIVMISFKLCRP